ncbi:MAG: DnaD domain protein [Parasporobacterium sp.]|nr:DnaD domain protein [Parasporobacterium sp.]
MSKFKLQQEVFTQATRIPNCFIEKYMPKAAGEFVKIYIYLLKCVEENRSELSIAKIADALEDSEKDVIRALKYWEKKGLLKLEFEEGVLTSLRMISFAEMTDDTEKITVNVSKKTETPSVKAKEKTKPEAVVPAASVSEEPVPAVSVPEASVSEASVSAVSVPEDSVTEASVSAVSVPEDSVSEGPAPADFVSEAFAPAASVSAASVSEGSAQAASVPAAPAKKQYSAQEIAAFSQKDDITLLLYSIQKYMGRALSGSDINTVLFFYDTLHLPADVIEYLFEYCVSKGHKNMRYIEKTGIAWAEQGVTTLKAAKTINGIYSDQCYPVLKAFGLGGRNPSRGEADFVSRWTLSYGFKLEMILEACNRTMNTIHQPSFEYTDSILKRWKAEGVSSLKEVKALDKKREIAVSGSKESAKAKKSEKKKSSSGNKFNNFDQRTYDYSELEEKLFNV